MESSARLGERCGGGSSHNSTTAFQSAATGISRGRPSPINPKGGSVSNHGRGFRSPSADPSRLGDFTQINPDTDENSKALKTTCPVPGRGRPAGEKIKTWI